MRVVLLCNRISLKKKRVFLHKAINVLVIFSCNKRSKLDCLKAFARRKILIVIISVSTNHCRSKT